MFANSWLWVHHLPDYSQTRLLSYGLVIDCLCLKLVLRTDYKISLFPLVSIPMKGKNYLKQLQIALKINHLQKNQIFKENQEFQCDLLFFIDYCLC